MIRREFYCKWLEENTSIASSSIAKYAGAINTISKELLDKKLIDYHLYKTNDSVLVEKARMTYFSIQEFKDKDERGNRMYSRALIYYIQFLQNKNNL